MLPSCVGKRGSSWYCFGSGITGVCVFRLLTGGVDDFGAIKLQAPVCQDVNTHSNLTFPQTFMEIYVRLLLQLLNLNNDLSFPELKQPGLQGTTALQ